MFVIVEVDRGADYRPQGTYDAIHPPPIRISVLSAVFNV
jgi:hypothetical protein